MYLPAAFKNSDPAVAQALIAAHPLATLIVKQNDDLTVNHVPLMVEPGYDWPGRLIGHVARANPIWQAIEQDAELVVVFQGENGYISPSWYASKAEHGKVVPTWNYAVAHCRGRVECVHDAAGLRRILNTLTGKFEGPRQQPWSIDDAPDGYIEKMLTAIVGIRLHIADVQVKVKLSQNQPPANQRSLLDGLDREGFNGMAAAVRAAVASSDASTE